MAFLQVNEQTTALYQATFSDETGTAIPSGSFVSLELTLYNNSNSGIINSREGQNVLNANNVSVSGSGAVTWTMQPSDNSIIGSSKTEHHTALFEAVYDTNKELRHEVNIVVTNLSKVT